VENGEDERLKRQRVETQKLQQQLLEQQLLQLQLQQVNQKLSGGNSSPPPSPPSPPAQQPLAAFKFGAGATPIVSSQPVQSYATPLSRERKAHVKRMMEVAWGGYEK
jgi:hypothetical protein